MQDTLTENKISAARISSQPRVADTARSTHSRRSEDLGAAAQQFEALIAVFLVRSLRQAMSPGGFYSNGYGGEFFQGMMEEVLAQKLAERERLGIAEALEKQLTATPTKTSVTRYTPSLESSYSTYIAAAAQRHHVDANLLRAVILQESAGNPLAVSQRGAAGLMQLMPETAALLGVEDRFDAEKNIDGGAKYLSDLLRRFGELDTALAAYNAGPSAVEKYRGVPPFAETRTFVQRVLASYRALQSKEIEPVVNKEESAK